MTAAAEEPVDWTRVTRRLLLARVPEDIRVEMAGWLAIYRNDVRATAFHEAAAVLDSIARKQDCFDDADMQRKAQETFECARALRVYIAASTNSRMAADTTNPKET